MSRPTLYPPANHSAQWYEGAHPGSVMELAAPVLVLHTTEGGDWPTYSGGSIAPTLTYKRGVGFRQHFPLNVSARALRNLSGGVQTNTAGVIQIELIGTCTKGGPGFYWPGAGDSDLRDLAEFIVWLRANGYPLPLKDPGLWLSYPSSYGPSKARMSNAEWQAFSGVCGHQHVPENVHGDPGGFPIDRLFLLVRELEHPVPPVVKPPIISQDNPTKEPDVALTDADVQRIAKAVWAYQIGLSPEQKAAGGYSADAYAAGSYQKGADLKLRQLLAKESADGAQ